MEQVQVCRMIPRYKILREELDYLRGEDLMSYLAPVEEVVVLFNTNFTGAREFNRNFLEVEEFEFNKVVDIKEKAKELQKPFWTVLSFYRENGYHGVYARTGEEALTVKCNNWVNSGKEGFYYVVFANIEEQLNRFVGVLQTYINEGIFELSVYDEQTNESSEHFLELGSSREDYTNWKNKLKEVYGFVDKDFPY